MQYGPFSPATVASVGPGAAWSNPDRAKVEDAAGFSGQAFASIATAGGKSALLMATGFDFSAVPHGATVTGVLVEWKKRRLLPLVCDDDESRIVKAGAINVANRAASGHWPVGLAWVGYGGQGDPLGLTAADVKDARFGAALSAKEVVGDSRGTAMVDAVRVTVWAE